MNILKYKRHYVYQDSWGSGGAEGNAGSMNNRDNGDSSSRGSNFNFAAQKDQDAAPDAAATSGAFTPDHIQQAQSSPDWNIGTMFNSDTGSGTNLFAQDSNNYLNNMFTPQSWSGIGYNAPAPNYGGYTTGSNLNVTTPEQAQSAQTAQASTDTPGFLQRMGIVPGMTSDKFLSQETPSQRADRMGMIGDAIGAVGQAAFSAAMPAPMRGLLGLAKAYDGYSNGTLSGQQAAGKALAGFGGYAGVVGNTLQGNVGGAVSNALGLAGADKLTQIAGGIGANAAMGKDVTSQTVGLASYYAGLKAGGPVAGVFAQQLGKDLASVFRKK